MKPRVGRTEFPHGNAIKVTTRNVPKPGPKKARKEKKIEQGEGERPSPNSKQESLRSHGAYKVRF